MKSEQLLAAGCISIVGFRHAAPHRHLLFGAGEETRQLRDYCEIQYLSGRTALITKHFPHALGERLGQRLCGRLALLLYSSASRLTSDLPPRCVLMGVS